VNQEKEDKLEKADKYVQQTKLKKSD